jgi:phosphate transport system permease protein
MTTSRARRRILSSIFVAFCAISVLLALVPLALVLFFVVAQGIQSLNWAFFTQMPRPVGEQGGGMANSIVGTLMLTGLGALFAVPIGILSGVYTSEYGGTRFASGIRFAADTLNGVPSIVIGVFVFGLLVAGGKQSGWAGSFALAVVMLPLVARASMEVLELVPNTLREASFGLGVSRWRTILRVVMPTVIGGVLTGTILAIARAAGETAPLLFTSSIAANAVTWDPNQALNSMPVTIFVYSEAPDKSLNDQAWAAAFLLMIFVLVASLAARALLARSRRKLEGG